MVTIDIMSTKGSLRLGSEESNSATESVVIDRRAVEPQKIVIALTGG